MLKKTIKIKLQVEGIHYWPEAKEVFPEVGFLSFPHRHIFYITLTKEVSHNDRDIEIILFKRDVLKYLYSKFSADPTNPASCLEFGRRSCEDIAEDLLLTFGLESAEVLEDNENGAFLSKVK